MQVFCLANFKGGTGKTATACNLAALLAREGRRVLLIDADAQHNASDFFCEDWDGATLTDVLEGTAEPFWPENVAESGYDNLSVLCADMGLLRLDLASILTGSNAAQKRFDDLIDTLRQDAAFDYVLVDCPPSFTAASVAALVNADTVILPTRADAFSRRGALELIDQLRGVARASYQATRFKLLLTMADRSNLAKQAEALLRDSAGLSVCRTVIRSGVAVGESSYARQPLYQYCPRAGVARDYEALLREVLEWTPSDAAESCASSLGEGAEGEV